MNRLFANIQQCVGIVLLPILKSKGKQGGSPCPEYRSVPLGEE